MNNYLTFIWESIKNPTGIENILAPLHLILFSIFAGYLIKIVIEIIKLELCGKK